MMFCSKLWSIFRRSRQTFSVMISIITWSGTTRSHGIFKNAYFRIWIRNLILCQSQIHGILLLLMLLLLKHYIRTTSTSILNHFSSKLWLKTCRWGIGGAKTVNPALFILGEFSHKQFGIETSGCTSGNRIRHDQFCRSKFRRRLAVVVFKNQSRIFVQIFVGGWTDLWITWISTHLSA